MLTLPPLPFALDALEPYAISAKALDFHYHKHHQGYVNNLNNLLNEQVIAHDNLENLIAIAKETKNLPVFNNAAQVWNHDFFWHSMTPQPMKIPNDLKIALESGFSSLENFKHEFITKGGKHFASGWLWLVQDKENLLLVTTSNAEQPMLKPLFVIDLWEHSYYLDFQNLRIEYLKKIWEIINWEFVYQQFVGKKYEFPKF